LTLVSALGKEAQPEGTDEMSKFLASLSGGSGVAVTAAVGVVVVAGAAWTQFGAPRDAEVTPVIATGPAQEAVVTAPAVENVALPVETPEVDIARILPAFDEVRRESDGMTVIAGRAAPQARVQVLQNGIEIASAQADASGKFATLVMIPPDGQGHVLSLVEVLGEQTFASLDEIVLAPLAAPIVAEAVAREVVAAEAVAREVVAAEAVAREVVAAEAVAPESVAAEAVAPEGVVAVVPSEAPVTETVVAQADVDQEADVVPSPVEPVAKTALPESEPTPEVIAAQVVPDVQGKAVDQIEDITDDVSQAAETIVAEAIGSQTVISPVPQPQSQPQTPAAVAVSPAKTVAPQAVAVLKSTADGVELLNPNAPEVMDNVALDTISYSQVGDVQLSGRAQADTRAVRVYLNNDAVVSLDVGDDGRWRGDLPNVDEGIYTLRVDEVATDGTVTSRVETPFKRESPETLAAASAAQSGPIKAITVQQGATLWAIARERYGSGELYVRVFEANRDTIRNADLIYPGQIFDLPD
jgi:nucleoid-associated protein YgaU